MLKVAIIGFGGIAQSAHIPAYKILENRGIAKLIAVCDITPSRFKEKLEINIGAADTSMTDSLAKYSNWENMLNTEEVDLVDICVPTPWHAEISIAVLNKGYHVLCEKPMSLDFENCEAMITAAKKAGKKLMIGQCLRFNPIYTYLKKIVEDKVYGEVKGGLFKRFSAPPFWGWENWYMDYEKSHGCVNDMHIHDIDIIRYLFGEPESVSCTTKDIYSKKDSAFSTLKYPDYTVHAIGDWSLEGMKFAADYLISFEKATIEMSGGVVTVHPRGGDTFVVELENVNPYFKEIEFFVDNILSGEDNIVNPSESAARTIKLIQTLIKSSDNNSQFVPFEV